MTNERYIEASEHFTAAINTSALSRASEQAIISKYEIFIIV